MSELSIVTSCLVRAVAFAVLSNVAAQSPTQDGVEGPVSTDASVRVVALAASPDSAEPNLTVASDGSVILSWVEELAGRGHVLRFAVRNGGAWSKPREVARGTDWFVNWADFPSVMALPNRTMAAHWLARSGSGTYDYDVMIARSSDEGETWSQPVVPHRDGVKAEHGFVSLFAQDSDTLGAVWLDGREMSGTGSGHGRGSMTLRYVELLPNRKLARPALLDPRVCECCQTSAAMTVKGPVVVYRDRSVDEIRDISIVRLVDGEWTTPVPVSRDGWQIQGCPVNGPSVAAVGQQVAVAWFTAAKSQSRVYVARSSDAGANFAKPIKMDGANPSGRVDVAISNDGTAFVCWLAQPDGVGAVHLRRVAVDGTVGQVVTIAKMGTDRRSGFPQMALAGDELVFAWTGAGVKTAVLSVQ